jgi:predicted HTH transcriptional regulator
VEFDQNRVDQRVATPSESLNVEVKSWIDPATPEDQVKIVKAVLALRNRDGGELVIGFNDVTMQPEQEGVPVKPTEAFHPDVVQALISKYASEHFEIRDYKVDVRSRLA